MSYISGNSIISSNPKTINIKEKLAQLKLLYKMGFSLIPLGPKSKFPFSPLLVKIDGKPKWSPFRDRRASWVEIENWIDKYPEINIGIITGQASNLVILDIDHRYNENNDPNIIIDSEIKTAEVVTSRDKHIYLRTDQKIDSGVMRTPSGIVIGDILGEGKYVVTPPSIHESGTKYKWSENRNLTTQELFKYENINFEKDEANNLLRITTKKYYSNPNKNKKKTSVNKNEAASSNNKKLNKWWHQLQTEFEVAQQIFDLMGVEVEEIGKSFNCPFHQDEHPSVSLYQLPKEKIYNDSNQHNAIYFADFHCKGRDVFYDPETDQDKYLPKNGSLQQWFNLAEIFFAIETDRELQKLTPGVGVIWWIRALDKLGYINELPSIAAKKLPEIDNTIYRFKKDKKDYAIKKESVQKVYQGFIYLLKLKTIYDKNQKGTTYSYRFIASWAGVSKTTASKAMKYLMQKKYIKVIKETEGKKANILDLNRAN